MRLGFAVKVLARADIRMYRMTASLAPYATHPDHPRFHHQLDEARSELEALGARARELDLRLSTHPGQYVVLNSEDEGVREGAIRDLELQAALLDAMGLGPEAVVVLALHERTGLRVVWDILPPLPRPGRDPGPRGARGRARHLARRRDAEDPLLLAQDRDGGAPQAHREARRALLGAPAAARPRGHDRPDRLRALPARHRRRAGLRRHARGQGEGPRPAPPARPARGTRPAVRPPEGDGAHGVESSATMGAGA